MWYWFLKFAVVGPILKLAYAPRWLGKENLPRSGGYVLAANHTGVIETAIVPFGVRRRVTFVAKSKYYRGSGAKGRLLAWFLKAIGQVPIEPASAEAAQPALDAARGASNADGPLVMPATCGLRSSRRWAAACQPDQYER